MSYASKRPAIGKRRRRFLYARAGGRCYLCGEMIDPDSPYHIDHEIARELGGSDDDDNLRPVHPPCHRAKSRADVQAIAKSNRIRRENGPPELRRKTPHPIRTRAKATWPKRAFPKRIKT